MRGSRGGKVSLGARSLFSQFCRLLGTALVTWCTWPPSLLCPWLSNRLPHWESPTFAPHTPAPQLPGPSCFWEHESLCGSCFSGAQPIPSLRRRLGEGAAGGEPSNASYTVTSSSRGPRANSSLSLRGGSAPASDLVARWRMSRGPRAPLFCCCQGSVGERG